MADLLIRKLEPEVIERLKQQAKRNGRSMQAEAREIIENGVQMTMAEWVKAMRELREDDPPWKPGDPTAAEDIRAEHEERDRNVWRAIFNEEMLGDSDD